MQLGSPPALCCLDPGASLILHEQICPGPSDSLLVWRLEVGARGPPGTGARGDGYAQGMGSGDGSAFLQKNALCPLHSPW